jgi:glutaredoxin 3
MYPLPRCPQHGLLLDDRGACVRCVGTKPASATWVYALLAATLMGVLVLFGVTRAVGAYRDAVAAGVVGGPKTGLTSKTVNAALNQRVVVYTTSTCPACRTAKAWLKSNQVPFAERNIDSDEDALREYASLRVRSVPTFVIDGEVTAGFDSRRVQAALSKPAPTRVN